MFVRSIFILLLFCWQNAFSLEMYRYKNEYGKWAFTDKKPNTEKEVKKTILKERRKESLTLKLEKFEIPNGVIYKARNELFAPVALQLKINNKKNVELDRDIAKYQVIPANSIKTVLKISAIDKTRGWSFSLSSHYTLGDPNSKIDKNYPYGVPFARGTKHQISQGFNGQYSHTDEHNRYAVDIALPVSTHINAARAGTVVDVAFKNYKSGVTSEFLSKANVIRVLHDDGSIATYAHLKWEGIRVKAGDTVQQGEYIADSGNTGFSSGPHLHFVLHENKDNKMVSFPFKFSQKLGTTVEPLFGQWLKSP